MSAWDAFWLYGPIVYAVGYLTSLAVMAIITVREDKRRRAAARNATPAPVVPIDEQARRRTRQQERAAIAHLRTHRSADVLHIAPRACPVVELHTGRDGDAA